MDHDYLYGENGMDYLYGDPGDDYLDGGDDIYCDAYFGGSGADTFVAAPVEFLVNNAQVILAEGDVVVLYS